MLLFVHFVQIARALTTYESMRGNTEPMGPVMTGLATGSLSADSAQITASGAGPDPTTSSHGHAHNKKAKEGCFASWKKMLGLDVFFNVAFNGYYGSKDRNNKREKQRKRGSNPFTRGILRNCQDFWGDGPVFGRKERSGVALLGGQRVDYASMYDMPRGGGMRYRGGYEEVAVEDGEGV
jgi:hypothetical protein